MIKDERKILSPEYASSNERLRVLRELAVDGKDAEAVIKYADIFKSECAKNVLDCIERGTDYKQASLEYNVACKFMNMLRHAADVGKQKQETYERTMRERRHS